MMFLTKLQTMENVQIMFIVTHNPQTYCNMVSKGLHATCCMWNLKVQGHQTVGGGTTSRFFKNLLSDDATVLPEVGTRAVGRSPLIGEADECSLAQDATRGVVSSSCVGVVLVADRATEPA